MMLQSGFTKAKTFTALLLRLRATPLDVKIVGLPKSGNTRVEVTAEFAGENGGTLKATDYAIRSNNTTDSLTAMTYLCARQTGADNPDAPVVDGKPTIQVARNCVTSRSCGYDKVSDLDEATTFAPDNQFLIIAKVMDSAGNPLSKTRVSVPGRRVRPRPRPSYWATACPMPRA